MSDFYDKKFLDMFLVGNFKLKFGKLQLKFTRGKG